MESLWHKYLIYLNLHVLVVGCGRVGQSFSDFHNISLKYDMWGVLYQIHCVLENNSKMAFGYPGRLSTHLNSIFLNSFSNNSSSRLIRYPGTPHTVYHIYHSKSCTCSYINYLKLRTEAKTQVQLLLWNVECRTGTQKCTRTQVLVRVLVQILCEYSYSYISYEYEKTQFSLRRIGDIFGRDYFDLLVCHIIKLGRFVDS